jgi:hypothetical protein
MKTPVLLLRFRYWLLGLIALVGFWSPWERLGKAHGSMHLGTTWLYLAGGLTRSRILPIAYASTAVMGMAILLAFGAALLRTWAVAYRDEGAEHNAHDHALYLGLWLHMLALSVLMPPGGALFAVVLVTVVIAGLVGIVNGGVSEMHREPRLPVHGVRVGWGRAVLREVYFWGVAITYIAFASRYNVSLVEQGVLVSLGVAVVLRGLLRPSAAGVRG